MRKPPAGRPAGVPKPYRRSGSLQWQVKVKVPKGAGGPRQIARSLKTTDWAEAMRRAPVVVAEIRREIEARRRNPDGTRKDRQGEPSAEQRRLEEWWAERRLPDPRRPGRYMIAPEDDGAWEATVDNLLGDPLSYDGEKPTYEPEREAAAARFAGIVLGSRTPVAHNLERYLREEDVKGSYKARTRNAVARLTRWLKAERLADDIGSVNVRRADQFAEALAGGEITTATLNSLISALSAYWKWLARRGLADRSTNPWAGQSRKVVSRDRNADKRPFTDQEVVALLAGETSRTLHDLMRLAALSGLRLNEITNLRVGDTANGVFDVTVSKTAAGIRKVPIHPDVEAIVSRRRAGKPDDAFLFEELTAPPSRPTRRGGKVGERFTAYRRALKLDQRQEGRRQSDADFHSFRRWFATKAEQAGQPPHIISAVLGHATGRGGIAMTRYSGGPSHAQLRAVVESVRLPEGALIGSPEGPLMGSRRASRTPSQANAPRSPRNGR